MISNFATFFSDYEKLSKIISEYGISYQFGMSQASASENASRVQLLNYLQDIENRDREQKLSAQHQVQEQIQSLRSILEAVDRIEHSMNEPRYQQYKEMHRTSEAQHLEASPHSRTDINVQVDTTINAIERISQSKMPKALSAICSFFNPSYRHDAYQRIVENREHLEQMIVAAEYDVHANSVRLQNEIEQDTLRRIGELQSLKNQMEHERATRSQNYYTQLKKLLLDGLEQIFCGDTIYRDIHSILAKYNDRYLQVTEELDTYPENMIIGIVQQHVAVQDDGTIQSFLSTIIKETAYHEGRIIIPIALKKYFQRPISVSYHTDQNNDIYDLFTNYAIQLIDIYKREGVICHLVDCTHLGSKYSVFTTVEGEDDSKRINVIRTNMGLKDTLDSLSEYIIESNTHYLRNEYQSIEEYNAVSTTKRKIQLLFISNISEITSSDMLSKLITIMRNGGRCGVHTFVAISRDEFQVSNYVSQTRVNAISAINDLCDQIFMSSNGNLSFGNGLPQFIAPQTIRPEVITSILKSCVAADETQITLPFADYMISEDRFFTETCYEEVTLPIGLDEQGNEYSLRLNQESAYVLIGGNPACGKSSLLHTIILQCITRYSPQNLQVYVADLKDGAEFDVYAQRGVQSVKVVLDDSEADIASSFLSFIKANVELRLSRFNDLQQQSGQIVKNIEQFYNINNARRYVDNLPRMLLIIDEFQSLFDSSRETGSITNWLVRMCRTVGIYIIMASQRAQGDSAATANSFGSQTKEYFIYRGIMKLPYSGAREIMSEHCSDTNRTNPAIRKAQTLKKGQIIVNSNMGATEEDNRLIQCYYPSSDLIASICDSVSQKQGMIPGIILNSEKAVDYASANVINHPNIVLGESNRLFYDTCNNNTDPFRDDFYVAMNHQLIRRVFVCGIDERVISSVFWSVVLRYIAQSPTNTRVNILAANNTLESLSIPDDIICTMHIASDASEFVTYGNTQIREGKYVVNLLINPHEYSLLSYDSFSSPSSTVEKLCSFWNDSKSFTIVASNDYRKTKEDCVYCDSEIPHRIISVGNIASIRSVMSLDAAEKVKESPFNVIRPNVVKAYYYNKQTDKVGRFRLFDAASIKHQTTVLIKKNLENTTPDLTAGYAGLAGN